MAALFDARPQMKLLREHLPTRHPSQAFHELEEFLSGDCNSPHLAPGATDQSDKAKIISAVSSALDGLYVHRAFKRARYGSNPVERLSALARNLPLPEFSFQHYMLDIFLDLHDPHTTYQLPEPFRSATAFLPFSVEVCFPQYSDSNMLWFLVTHVSDGLQCEGFQAGARITHWNGLPMDLFVQDLAHRENGANIEACYARAVSSLTIKRLRRLAPPSSPTALIRYQPPGRTDAPMEMLIDWSVRTTAESKPTDLRTILFDIPTPQSLGWKVLDDPAVEWKITRIPHPSAQTLVDVGIIRIRSFECPEPTFLDALREILDTMQRLAPYALILDVRGNLGGIIPSGERLLQMLTPGPVTPAYFQFLNSPLVRRLAPGQRVPTAQFGLDRDTGAVYATAGQITPVDEANNIGQRYYGRVALITDAQCYSTTDIFAAGFQDHRIGPIIGLDARTGGGGANEWSYNEVFQAMGAEGREFPPLPNGSDVGIGVRQCMRTGKHHGEILEDFGVEADYRYQLNENDLLRDAEGFYQFAFEKLATGREMPNCRVALEVDLMRASEQDGSGDNFITVSFEVAGVDYCELYVNGNMVKLYRPLREGYRGVYEDVWGDELEPPSRVELKCYKILLRCETPFYTEEEIAQMPGSAEAVHQLVASRKILKDDHGVWRERVSARHSQSKAAALIPKANEVHYFLRNRGPIFMNTALEIAARFKALQPEAKFSFVTYGSAVQILDRPEFDIFDLGLPEDARLSALETAIASHVAQHSPSLVIAHEEFEVLSHAVGLKSVFLTDWWPDPEDWAMTQLVKATGVVFLNVHKPELNPTPHQFANKVKYSGPLLRPRRYHWGDAQARQQLREKLGQGAEAQVISVFVAPGNRNELVAPLRGVLEEACTLLDGGPVLNWDHDAGPDFDLAMAGSDLAITKNDRNIVMELAGIGTPIVSVSHGLNTTDFWFTTSPALHSNGTISSSGLTAAKLADLMRKMLAKGKRGAIKPLPFPAEASAAAAQSIVDLWHSDKAHAAAATQDAHNIA